MQTKSIIIPLVFFTALSVNAQTLTNRHFIYEGNISETFTAIQNPGPNTPISNRGWYSMFWGDSYNAGCHPVRLWDGPVRDAAGLFNFISDTGISEGIGFTPSSNSPNCSDKTKWGQMHSHYKNEINSSNPGGVGIFTTSGPLLWDSSSLGFFQPPTTGLPGIQGNFVGFRCGNKCLLGTGDPKNVFPFSGNSTDFDQLRFSLISTQTLPWLYAQDEKTQQVRQQMLFTLENISGTGSIQYLFPNAIKGIYQNAGASITNDPIQGGIAVIAGPIANFGGTTNYRANDGSIHPLFRSWNSPTQHSSWSGFKTFEVELTFNQFLNNLRLAVSESLHINPNLVTRQQLEERFGINFDNPMNWVLSAVEVAHENYNPIWQTSTTAVGGGFNTLKIISVP